MNKMCHIPICHVACFLIFTKDLVFEAFEILSGPKALFSFNLLKSDYVSSSSKTGTIISSGKSKRLSFLILEFMSGVAS